jgi:hypothetical protein
LAFWLITGQRLEDFQLYIRDSIAVTAGYNSAMFMQTTSVTAIWVALVCGALLVSQLIFFLRDNDKAQVVVGAFFLTLILFLLWKHAFTRYENHASRFFFFYPQLLLSSWLLNRSTRGFDRIPLTATAVAIVCALRGATATQHGAVTEASPRTERQLTYAYRVLANYMEYDLAREKGLREAKDKYYLPKIRAVVGSRTVDVFGYRQGIALLNELNYVPRPVFQGYSAYTPSLIALNTEHYQSINRPEFVISKLETIDHRFPTLDDSKVLLELLYRYQPVASESGWQLWKAVNPFQTIKPRSVFSVNAQFGQEVQIPAGSPIWLELELRQTGWGKVRSLLYKSALVMIELGDDAGQTSRYRMVPSMATSGFLLNPEVATDEQLLRAARNEPLPNYKWFKITTTDSTNDLFARSIKVTFSTLPSLGAAR